MYKPNTTAHRSVRKSPNVKPAPDGPPPKGDVSSQSPAVTIPTPVRFPNFGGRFSIAN